MKARLFTTICACAFIGLYLVVSRCAYASVQRDEIQNWNVVDTPPPARRIAEPTVHPNDTAKSLHIQRKVDVDNSNPQEVVNPE